MPEHAPRPIDTAFEILDTDDLNTLSLDELISEPLRIAMSPTGDQEYVSVVTVSLRPRHLTLCLNTSRHTQPQVPAELVEKVNAFNSDRMNSWVALLREVFAAELDRVHATRAELDNEEAVIRTRISNLIPMEP